MLLEEQVAVLGDELADGQVRAGERHGPPSPRAPETSDGFITSFTRRSSASRSVSGPAALRCLQRDAHAYGGVEEPEDLAGGLRAHGHGLDVAQRELVQRLAQRRGLIDRDDAARPRRGSRPRWRWL